MSSWSSKITNFFLGTISIKECRYHEVHILKINKNRLSKHYVTGYVCIRILICRSCFDILCRLTCNDINWLLWMTGTPWSNRNMVLLFRYRHWYLCQLNHTLICPSILSLFFFFLPKWNTLKANQLIKGKGMQNKSVATVRLIKTYQI